MKIEKASVVITGIPYFESITVQQADGRAEILLRPLSTEPPWAYTPAEVTELRDALTAALEQAAQLTGQSGSTTPREPSATVRVWRNKDPEPAGVTRVVDEAGDAWEKDDSDWCRTAGWRRSWSDLLDLYGPLTEVITEVPA